MRWLVPTLAAAVTAVAVPAAAQSYGYGYGQPGYGYGYGQSGYGSDFDYRRCYQNESRSRCQDRLRRESYDRGGSYGDGDGRSGYDDRRNSYNYDDRSRGYYGQPYADPRYYDRGYSGGYGYDRGGYYGDRYDRNGYSSGGYYGGGYGRDSGASVALTILGIALGAQILGSLDDRDYWDRNRHDDSYNDWCRRQYSSYDWNSGTYRHQDGSRRYCRRW